MTKKVVNSAGDSLKRQRELPSSNNEKKYECLKKRKSEKLQELFGDATLPDSKMYVTDMKKPSITKSPQIIQNIEGDISSHSGIGFLDALNMVSSGSNKNGKINKQKIRADDDEPKNDNKPLTTKTTTVDLENHETKNQNKSALRKEKVAKTDENKSKHDKKHRDKKEETKITKIIEHGASKKNKNKSDKEGNMIITKKQHEHNKNVEKNNENMKVGERKCEGKEKSLSKNILKRNLAISTAKEVSSSSGIGFAEVLQMTAINNGKSKKKKEKLTISQNV